MEKILKDRHKDGVRKFLVKWEGYDSSHNSWEPASVFVSPKVIEDYWESKSKISKISLRTPSVNFMSIIMIIMMILNTISRGFCYTITDSFQLCSHNQHSHKIDMSKQCTPPKSSLIIHRHM